jgi:hypothetical protein
MPIPTSKNPRAKVGRDLVVMPAACASILDEPLNKIMGRLRTGTKPLMGLRELMTRAALMKWAENQPDKPTPSETIRRLVEIGLKAKGK